MLRFVFINKRSLYSSLYKAKVLPEHIENILPKEMAEYNFSLVNGSAQVFLDPLIKSFNN